jgi:hypothetical protein
MSAPSQPNARFEKLSQQLKTHITTAFQMGVDSAKKADAENFGIDDRIKVAHQFVDLEVKGHAEMLETLIGGPLVSPVPLEDFDTIDVKPEDYEREVVITDDFVRVGGAAPSILKCDKLVAVPKIIPKNVTQFRLYLTDLSFIGANYRGLMTLQPTASAVKQDPTAAPSKRVITAGL